MSYYGYMSYYGDATRSHGSLSIESRIRTIVAWSLVIFVIIGVLTLWLDDGVFSKDRDRTVTWCTKSGCVLNEMERVTYFTSDNPYEMRSGGAIYKCKIVTKGAKGPPQTVWILLDGQIFQVRDSHGKSIYPVPDKPADKPASKASGVNPEKSSPN